MEQEQEREQVVRTKHYVRFQWSGRGQFVTRIFQTDEEYSEYMEHKLDQWVMVKHEIQKIMPWVEVPIDTE